MFSFSFQSSVQDWGEEVEEGAIYNVTLKRVQIQQAANKGARWLGVSVMPQNRSWRGFFLDEWRSKLFTSQRTHENGMLFPPSVFPAAAKKSETLLFKKKTKNIKQSAPWIFIMCRCFIKATWLAVCRLLSWKAENFISSFSCAGSARVALVL